MARLLTSGMQDAITAQNMRPFFLMEGHFDSGELDLWTGLGNLAYGGKNYLGVGNILSMSSIKETKQVEAPAMTVTLSGLDESIIAIAMNENYPDRPAYIYLGAFDDNWQVITSPYLAFEGRMDTMPIEESDDTATVTLTIENVLIDLTKSNVWNYTPEDQKLLFSGDTGFDRVTGLQSKDIVVAG